MGQVASEAATSEASIALIRYQCIGGAQLQLRRACLKAIQLVLLMPCHGTHVKCQVVTPFQGF